MKNIEIDKKKRWYRLWEIFPGATTWAIFVIPIIMALYCPNILAALVIIYAVYWLVKAFMMSARLIIAYRKYRHDIKIDWLELLQKLPQNWQKIYHVLIIPEYKESIETLTYSFEAIVKSNYPLNKIICVLAIEEREGASAIKTAEIIKKRFGHKFFHFQYIIHPKNLPDEMSSGKGPNLDYAGREIYKYIKYKNISPKNVLVTSLDSDHRPHPQYLAALTHHYLTSVDPIHKSYQPLPMFFNNVWDVPIPMRSIGVGSTFWQMIESTRPYRLRNFAAHSQPLAGLLKTNFWSRLTIVEDGHQFWRSYFAFDGKYSVIPINIPIYQDAVLSPKGYIATFIEQYLQKKRWAWGASDIAYVITNIIRLKRISPGEKFMQTWRLIEGHLSWSTTSVVLLFVGWLPVLINPEFSSSVLAYNFPVIYSRILTIALSGLIITLTLSTLMLPPRPKKKMTFSIILEWIISPVLIPISNVFFSSIPAIHAQTSLMRGKYMEYRVTEKKAVKYKESEKFKTQSAKQQR